MKSKNIIEALLLISKEPLSIEKIALVSGVTDVNIIEADLAELEAEYINRGIKIFHISGGWQLGTNPEALPYVEKMLNTPVETALSHPALETLAIIAYRQPITRNQIEQIRGVNSDSPIDSLIAKRMIREIGRDDSVGRPYLYGTTEDFLRHFGLGSLDALPRDQFNNLTLPPEVILGQGAMQQEFSLSPEAAEARQMVPADFIPPMESNLDQSSVSRPNLQ